MWGIWCSHIFICSCFRYLLSEYLAWHVWHDEFWANVASNHWFFMCTPLFLPSHYRTDGSDVTLHLLGQDSWIVLPKKKKNLKKNPNLIIGILNSPWAPKLSHGALWYCMFFAVNLTGNLSLASCRGGWAIDHSLERAMDEMEQRHMGFISTPSWEFMSRRPFVLKAMDEPLHTSMNLTEMA